MKHAYDHMAYRHMPLKTHITVLAPAAGRAVQQDSGEPVGPAFYRTVIYPSEGDFEYSEERVIKKQLQMTTRRETVSFNEQ